MMEITKQADESQCALTLNGDMTIYTAMENKVDFEPYFNVEENITLDMSAVNEFDSSGFQMLLLLERQALKKEKTFNIVQRSPAVSEVLALYKKEDWFG
jgi:anti-anti-sigma factor